MLRWRSLLAGHSPGVRARTPTSRSPRSLQTRTGQTRSGGARGRVVAEAGEGRGTGLIRDLPRLLLPEGLVVGALQGAWGSVGPRSAGERVQVPRAADSVRGDQEDPTDGGRQ